MMNARQNNPAPPDDRIDAQRLPRPRLIQRILTADSDAVWISAPQGFGKSTLLRELHQTLQRQTSPDAIALMTLSAEDGPHALHQQLRNALPLTAASSVSDTQTESIGELLMSLPRVDDPSARLHLLIDGLDTRYHLALIHYLVQGVQHYSRQVHLYLCVDNFVPFIPDSLFMDRRLLRIDADDLAMNREDIASLFARNGKPTTERELERLLSKSDGMAAPLNILLNHYEDSIPHQCRHITLWIEHSLLPCLSPVDRLRLASLSILTEFDAEQAALLIGVSEPEAQSWIQLYVPLLFRRHDHQQPFVWSELMLTFFQNVLLSDYRDLLPRIFARAEPFLAQCASGSACMDYILEMSAKPWAQDLLLARCRSWYGQRDASAVIHMVEQLDGDVLAQRAELVLYYGWALIVHRRIPDASEQLAWLEHYLSTQAQDERHLTLKSNLQVLHALARFFQHPTPPPNERVQVLEPCLNQPSWFQGEVLSLYANMLHAVGVSDLSKPALQQAIQFHERNHNLVPATHARVLSWQCEFNEGLTQHALDQANAHLAALKDTLATTHDKETKQAARLAIAMTETGLADFLYEANDLPQAKALYDDAIPDLLKSDWTYASIVAQVGLTRLLISEGLYDDALEEIEHIKRRVPYRDNTSLNAILCFEAMRIMRARGQSVLPVATEYGLDIQHLSVESLFMNRYSKERLYWIKCYIMMLIEQKNFTSALIYAVKGLIKSLGTQDTRCRAFFSNIKALCEFKLGQTREAFESMNISMQLVQEHRFIRALLNDDFGWRELWQEMDSRQLFSSDIVPRFITEVRAALTSSPTLSEHSESALAQQSRDQQLANSRQVGLTDKEFEILQLLAEGLCNKKIASRSEIALTTVKWHLQNIFGKLQARNRTEAVVKAQECSIIGKS